MLFPNLILYGIGAILFLMAILAAYFIVLEIVQLMSDIGRNLRLGAEDSDSNPGPVRRIVPFRDRGTVERLIGYFTRQDKN